MYDSIRTTEAGLEVDGSRPERELGLTYLPIRQSIQEELAAYS